MKLLLLILSGLIPLTGLSQELLEPAPTQPAPPLAPSVIPSKDIYRSVVNAVTYMRDPQRVELFTNHSGANFGNSRSGRSVGFRIPGKRGGGQSMTVPKIGTVIVGRR